MAFVSEASVLDGKTPISSLALFCHRTNSRKKRIFTKPLVLKQFLFWCEVNVGTIYRPQACTMFAYITDLFSFKIVLRKVCFSTFYICIQCNKKLHIYNCYITPIMKVIFKIVYMRTMDLVDLLNTNEVLVY